MFILFQKINSVLWGGPMLVLLLGTHIILTVRSGFIQKNICKGLKYSVKGSGSFSILAANLAATLGTGNIIGVSTAIALGGPGALFWCVLTGLFGMATTYYEGYYGALYRTKSGGGPMYIMKNILKKPRLAAFYAFMMLFVCLGTGCLTQSNAAADIFRQTFHINPVTVGFAIAIITGFVIIGGKSSIIKVCTRIVPLMCILFLVCCVYLLVINAEYIPESIGLIVKSAFDIGGDSYSAAGGISVISASHNAKTAGTVLRSVMWNGMGTDAIFSSIPGGIIGGTIITASRYGIARGLFTNEAGLGSAAVFAAAGNDEPCEQGLISMTATFLDTIVICTITGLVIISSYLACPSSIEGYSIGGYMNAAFGQIPYVGQPLLAIAVAGFAISTIIGWFFAGEQAAMYLFGRNYDRAISVIRTIYIIMVFFGAVFSLGAVWEMADIFNVMLIVPNVYMLLMLLYYKKTTS